MNHPRWFLWGLVDGTILGALAGVLIMLPMGLSEAAVGYVEHAWASPVLSSFAGGAYGCFAGLIVGAVGGMAIDLLRQFGLDDHRAVWIVMTPVLMGAFMALPWQFTLVPATAVVADLIWRLHRLDRRTPTVLT